MKETTCHLYPKSQSAEIMKGKELKMANTVPFEYGGYHFTPFMKLTGAAGEFTNMARGVDYKTPLFNEHKFSYDAFFRASPIRDCDLFQCVENGKIYIPAYNLFEYKGEQHGIHPCLYKKSKEYER